MSKKHRKDSQPFVENVTDAALMANVGSAHITTMGKRKAKRNEFVSDLQSVNNGYDTYDSAVVAAKSAARARKIVPGLGSMTSWANPRDVRVEYLGKAGKGREDGEVICASFNAG